MRTTQRISILILVSSQLLLLHHHHHHHHVSAAPACNLFQGSWVPDNSLVLPYDSTTCPMINTVFNCRNNGRNDTDYLHYRWQPTGCDLPRFDGKALLEKYRGKKIMIVGDSLSYNQQESLTCLLLAAVGPNANVTTGNRPTGPPDAPYVVQTNCPYYTFEEYGVTVFEFLSRFLVEIAKEKTGNVLKLHSIGAQGDVWKEADVLIFNTGFWWNVNRSEKEWVYIQDGENAPLVKDMDRTLAFEKALTTWAKWVDSGAVNFTKTQVFFQGIYSAHFRSYEWGNTGKEDCAKETTPILGSKYPYGPPSRYKMVERVLSTIKSPVKFLDVTLLTQLRKDGHPGYSNQDPHGMNDCVHWCLPGVPDTWSQILYAYLTWLESI